MTKTTPKHPVGHSAYKDIGQDPIPSDFETPAKTSETRSKSATTAPNTTSTKPAPCPFLLGVEPTDPTTQSQDDTTTDNNHPMNNFVGLAALERACAHVAKADPLLAPLIDLHGIPERLLKKSGPSFNTLGRSIVFQQLSTKAAAAVFGRVLEACKCDTLLHPEAILACQPTELRSAGLSERKVSYLVDLATHFNDGRLSDDKIHSLDAEDLAEGLIKVKGIGPWSIHMFQMFYLGDGDILPVGDLGVRKGMQVLYGLKELPDATTMERIASSWAPYRSVGSYFMWRVEVPKAAAGSKKRKK